VQVDGAVAEARALYAAAREHVRAASGMRVLLALLHARASMTAQAVHALRTLAVKCLLGLAHDPDLRHILSKLQVVTLMTHPHRVSLVVLSPADPMENPSQTRGPVACREVGLYLG
jgi:hypothetical protein